MIDDLPPEPVYASTLRELPDARLALPVIVGEAGEILAFGCVRDERALLLGYSPWNGWQVVDAIDCEEGDDGAAVWNRLCGDAFDDPIPDCMNRLQDAEAARSLYEKLLEEA